MPEHAESMPATPRDLYRYNLPYAWGSLKLTPTAVEDYELIPLDVPTTVPPTDTHPFQTDVVVVGSRVARMLEPEPSGRPALYGAYSRLAYKPGTARIIVGFHEPVAPLSQLILHCQSIEIGRSAEEIAQEMDGDLGIPIGESIRNGLPEQLGTALSQTVARRVLEAHTLHAEYLSQQTWRGRVRDAGLIVVAGVGLVFGARKARRETAYSSGIVAATIGAYAYRAARLRQARSITPLPPPEWSGAADRIRSDIAHTFSRTDFANRFRALFGPESQ
ncbi:MAG TPA: hypothetical protein VFN56_05100 [Candidatus Saccharimonadales bacterium]|nr:hypothetical protein [Candidatus Saccharimonadales bacterium]